jgi:hypothetical protein
MIFILILSRTANLVSDADDFMKISFKVCLLFLCKYTLPSINKRSDYIENLQR